MIDNEGNFVDEGRPYDQKAPLETVAKVFVNGIPYDEYMRGVRHGSIESKLDRIIELLEEIHDAH